MAISLLLVAAGNEKYLAEAQQSIAWHRRNGWKFPIRLWIDPKWNPNVSGADVLVLPARESSLPPFVQAWYWKTYALQQSASAGEGTYCLLDTYARILRPDLFLEAETLAKQFPACLSLDPRGSLERELKMGLGISPEVRQDAERIPGIFPLWNTGVVFGSTSSASQQLFGRLEEISRGYLERSLAFREQITLAQAVFETGITPLTLPENFNVRRPLIDPCIVLHTRRYGHLFGLPEVDDPKLSFERWRHRAKRALIKFFRLETMVR